MAKLARALVEASVLTSFRIASSIASDNRYHAIDSRIQSTTNNFTVKLPLDRSRISCTPVGGIKKVSVDQTEDPSISAIL